MGRLKSGGDVGPRGGRGASRPSRGPGVAAAFFERLWRGSVVARRGGGGRPAPGGGGSGGHVSVAPSTADHLPQELPQPHAGGCCRCPCLMRLQLQQQQNTLQQPLADCPSPPDDAGLSPRVTNLQIRLLTAPSRRRRKTMLRSVISVRETHQVAEAQQEKNAKLREAFGISEYFVEGSSLDPNRRAKEAAARAAAAAAAVATAAAAAAAAATRKQYTLVRTPSPEPIQPAKESNKEGEKSKKRKKKTTRDSSSSSEPKKEKKKKSSKRHKRDK